MPFYEFTCDNPESPYHKNPKSEYWTVKEFIEKKDSMVCEITGEKLKTIIGAGIFNLKGDGWTQKGSY